ncbi:hypothetical protein [Paenibacillus campinasensis]|nr:hypothetical protein [Paenibacillus campinasensis]
MTRADIVNYLHYERDRLIEVIRIHEEEVARYNARLAQIERQIEKYETER